jgi:hypothetical protein
MESSFVNRKLEITVSGTVFCSVSYSKEQISWRALAKGGTRDALLQRFQMDTACTRALAWKHGMASLLITS